MVAIEALQLHIDATSVKWSIIEHPKLKLKAEHVRVTTLDQVRVRGEVWGQLRKTES
jgi:hypothetical protein